MNGSRKTEVYLHKERDHDIIAEIESLRESARFAAIGRCLRWALLEGLVLRELGLINLSDNLAPNRASSVAYRIRWQYKVGDSVSVAMRKVATTHTMRVALLKGGFREGVKSFGSPPEWTHDLEGDKYQDWSIEDALADVIEHRKWGAAAGISDEPNSSHAPTSDQEGVVRNVASKAQPQPAPVRPQVTPVEQELDDGVTGDMTKMFNGLMSKYKDQSQGD